MVVVEYCVDPLTKTFSGLAGLGSGGWDKLLINVEELGHILDHLIRDVVPVVFL